MNFIFLESNLYGIEKTIGHNLFLKGGIDGISASEMENVEIIRFTGSYENILKTVTIELTNKVYKIMNLKVLEIEEEYM